MLKKILNKKEAMEYLNIGRARLDAEIKSGHIRFKIIGKRLMFPLWTLDEWLNLRCSCRTTERAKAEQFVIEKINKIEKKNRTATGDLVELPLDEAFGLFYEKHAQYYARPDETLRKIKLISSYLTVKYVHQIDEAELSNFIQRRRYSGVSNSTINRELVILSSLLSQCRLWKYKTSNVRPTTLKLKEPAENIKYLKNWEVAQRIIDLAAPHLKPIIYTALYTGLRRSNILSLKWEQLDFYNDLINVKVKDRTKTGGKNLTVPMIDKLKDILQSQPKINEYVFNYKGSPIKDIKHSWHSIFYNSEGKLRDNSFPYVNFHTLRHTAATWILKKTNNLKITQEILGHANISTTLKYAHVMSEEKRKALNSVFDD